LLLLCALGPDEMNEVRLGPLTPHAVRTLRHIREFFSVQFRCAGVEASMALCSQLTLCRAVLCCAVSAAGAAAGSGSPILVCMWLMHVQRATRAREPDHLPVVCGGWGEEPQQAHPVRVEISFPLFCACACAATY
jgi:hypothetical protein